MTELELRILTMCSGKSYESLSESFGAGVIKSMLNKGYIALVNGKITRTELGMNISKPLDNTNENFGKSGYQLICDSDVKTEGNLICS